MEPPLYKVILGKEVYKMFKIDRKRNEGVGYAVFKVINLLVMLFIVVITLFPYLNVLAKALNDAQDTMKGGVTLWPRVLTGENFRVLLNDESMYRALGVTVIRVVLATGLGIVVQFMTAYAFSRNLKGMWIARVFFLIPMYIQGGLIPNYILFSQMGLLDNFWVYVLPWLFSFYNVIIIRSYIESSISDSIIEAAEIDGASEMRLFSTIVMPLCMPILATIALWIMVANWNEWTSTLYYVQNPDLHTLQYKLMQSIKETERITQLIQEAIQSGQSADELANSLKVNSESLNSAQIIVVTVPIILVYPFLQKYFTKGLTLGAVKG